MDECEAPSVLESFAACKELFPIPGPAFRYAGSRELTSADCETQTADYFAFLIRRTPADLLSHVRRINLHWQQRKGDQVFGALVDLFIALGPAGQALRRRLLKQVVPVLKPAQQRLLKSSIASGLTATDVLPEQSRDSVLLQGMLGGAPIVHVSEPDTDVHPRDAIEEANALLEFGQVEEARDLLEHAVLREPRRDDLQRELLEIYIHGHDNEGLLNMRQRLLERGHAVGIDWVRAANELECRKQAQPSIEY